MEFLVLLGPPGAGKGTLSRLLREASGFQPLSTGEIIRREMADPASDFGRLARPFMDRGEYVPDDLTLSLFFSILASTDTAKRLCLDGFPRTIPQAERFLAWVLEKGHRLVGCVFLDLPSEEALRRLQLRRVCSRCRAPYHLQERPPQAEGVCDVCGAGLIPREDDDPVLLARRQERHVQQTRPLLEWFRAHGGVVEENAEGDPAALLQRLREHFLNL